MASYPSQENKPLSKRPRLANVPEIYPQDPKQKEDELTPSNLKSGFSFTPVLPNDEYDSAKSLFSGTNAIGLDKFTRFLNETTSKKLDLNTLPDTSKRKQQVCSKDNIIQVTAKTKPYVDNWLKELTSTKPLTQLLSKRVPIFNKREEIIEKLCTLDVPLTRATWFIKVTNAYNMATAQEVRNNKKKAFDPCIEWTQVIMRYLAELFNKIVEHYRSAATPASAFAANTTIIDIDATLQQWNYCHMLTRHMYEEGLLENNDLLLWLLETLDKCWTADDSVLKIVNSQLIKYIGEFTRSVVMSRRLAHFCCKKLSQLCSDPVCVTASSWPSSTSPGSAAGVTCNSGPPSSAVAALRPPGGRVPTAVQPLFAKCTTCALHRDIVLMLTAFVHTVLVNCPSACVWFGLRSDGPSESLCGSPLDHLPCSSAHLPMPAGDDELILRTQLQKIETQVVSRSRASEMKWSQDRKEQSKRGDIVTRLFSILLALDKHHFDRVEQNSSLDTLYTKIFGGHDAKESKIIPHDIVIPLLCDWAISSRRHGRHRALVLGVLLEKRQAELNAKRADSSKQQQQQHHQEEKEGETTGEQASSYVTSSAPFHNLLFNFIDSRANSMSDGKLSAADNRLVFTNVVMLYAELIRREVFSHDAYMCTLISRGELSQGPVSAQTLDMDVSSVTSERMEKDEYDSFSHRDELARSAGLILAPPNQALTPKAVPTPGGGVARTPGAPPTPGLAKTPGAPHTPGHAYTPSSAATPGAVLDHSSAFLSSSAASFGGGMFGAGSLDGKLSRAPSKHVAFVTDIPIPQDDWRGHECNQRLVVLYGVGRARDAARRAIKKVLKDVQRLFGKKSCIDVTSGDVAAGKKKKGKDRLSAVGGGGADDPVSLAASFEATVVKFQRLSYYDQHAVTSVCLGSVLELFTTFTARGEGSQYLPLVENVAFLMELMEICLNVSGLLDFVVQILSELPAVQQEISKLSSSRAGASGGGAGSNDGGSRVSGLLSVYVSSLSLHLLGVLRKFHTCLLISQQQTVSIFDSLCKLVKHVTNPADCTSSERCILAYLYDLYNSCAFLKTKFAELFGSASARVKAALFASLSPNSASMHLDQSFLQDLFDNVSPRTRPDNALVKMLNDSAQDRYNFVCNVILRIFSSNNSNADKLYDLAILCAEVTARCNVLSADWLGVLKALCCSSNQKCGYYDLLTYVNVGDRTAYDSVAVFTMILICRHCFQLEDFIANVGMPSLLALCGSSLGDMDAEPGALLTCHILLRLLITSSSLSADLSADHGLRRGLHVRMCERNLLHAAHFSVKVGAMMAVLKAVLILSEVCSVELSRKSSPEKAGASARSGLEYTSLGEYARLVLREICSEEWVRVKFLGDLDNLFTNEVLLDKSLLPKQMQRLVQMICYPERPGGDSSHGDMDDEDEDDKNRNHIMSILQGLDLWTMRVAWLELNLMFKQANQLQTNMLLENVASCIMEIFQQCTDTKSDNSSDIIMTPGRNRQLALHLDSDRDVVWLISSLIGLLPKDVKGRVLKVVGHVLDAGSNAWYATGREEKEKQLLKSISLLGYQPFLSLVHTCLKDHDEQQEELLTLLAEQLEKFFAVMKELNDKGAQADERLKMLMLEVLQLRLSLVGNMMDTVRRDPGLTQTWVTQFTQLVLLGIVDVNDNSDLFLMVYDMLTNLILSTLISESGEREDGKKGYQSLMRKIKKEVGEKQSESLSRLRQLLPFPRKMIEFVTNEVYGDGKVKDKRKNLQVGSKQRINPWDIIEGQKHPTPLSWSWFCAIKLERKRLRYEQQHNKVLQSHKHPAMPASSHFLETPEYPPEDLEPPQVTPKEEVITEPPIVEIKQQEANKAKKKSKRKNSSNSRQTPSQPGATTPGMHPYNVMSQAPMDTMHSSMNPGPMYSSPMNTNWSNYPAGAAVAAAAGAGGGGVGGGGAAGGMGQASQPASQPPPQYYNQQPQPSAAMTAGRFASPLPDSRAHIANSLRMRAQHQMQGPQGVGGGSGGVVGGGQAPFLMPSQSQAPAAHPGNLMVQRGSMVRDRLKLMTSGQQPQPSQSGGFQQLPQPGGFGGYQGMHVGQPMSGMDNAGSMAAMPGQNFTGPAASQLASLPGQPSGAYLGQQGNVMGQHSQFSAGVTRFSSAMVGGGGPGGMGGMGGMGGQQAGGMQQGAGGYGGQQPPPGGYNQQQQQQLEMQRRQQLAALQQQQMQRQMTGPGQGGPFNQYYQHPQ